MRAFFYLAWFWVCLPFRRAVLRQAYAKWLFDSSVLSKLEGQQPTAVDTLKAQLSGLQDRVNRTEAQLEAKRKLSGLDDIKAQIQKLRTEAAETPELRARLSKLEAGLLSAHTTLSIEKNVAPANIPQAPEGKVTIVYQGADGSYQSTETKAASKRKFRIRRPHGNSMSVYDFHSMDGEAYVYREKVM